MVLELARTGADLKAVIGFHPGLALSRPSDSTNIAGSVLLCIGLLCIGLLCVGAEDPHVPAEQRAAFEVDLRAAGVDWRINLYGGVEHSFTHPRAGMPDLDLPPGLRYDRRADQRSWRAMLDLFEEVF
jgi:dienelactone hydrolase